MRTLHTIVVVAALAALSLGGCNRAETAELKPSPSTGSEVEAGKLDTLAVQLAAIREKSLNPGENEFDATYFKARATLGDWVGSRLAREADTLTANEAASLLNRELAAKALFCTPECEKKLTGFDARGFLEKIEVEARGKQLLVKTRMGILCGYDDTAYLYGVQNGRWIRMWESARSTTPERGYEPEILTDALITFDSAQDTPKLIATIGQYPWCQSRWQPVYSRVWQVGKPSPIVDERTIAFLDDHVAASLTADRFVVFLHIASLDVTVHNYLAVFRYAISESEVKRTAPFALTPRNFVDTWIQSDWAFSKSLSEAPALAALQAVHQREHQNSVKGEYLSATHACDDKKHWEIGIAFSGGADRYFRVVSQMPGEYKMTGVNEAFSKDCSEEDTFIDEENPPASYGLN